MPLDISHWPHFSVDSSLPPPPRCWSSDFFYICLILVLPEASLSEKSLMFSDKQSRSPSNHSPPSLTGELAEVLSLSLLSPSLASIGGSEQYKGIFLIGRKHPIRRQKKLATVSLIHITILTQLYYLWVIISKRTNNKPYILNHLIKQEIHIYLIQVKDFLKSYFFRFCFIRLFILLLYVSRRHLEMKMLHGDCAICWTLIRRA